MSQCCELGDILEDDRRPKLYITDNFFVTPPLGSIGIDGYVLIISKDHYSGIGDIPEEYHKELDSVVQTTKKVLQDQYGLLSLVFEHGPKVCSFRGGGCFDHAHLHIVPGIEIIDDLAVDLMKRLEFTRQFYRVDRVEGFKRMTEIYQEGRSSYLFVESPSSQRIVSEVNFFIPSQYLRQMIAFKIGTHTWDWRQHPHLETMERTIERLQGKF